MFFLTQIVSHFRANRVAGTQIMSVGRKSCRNEFKKNRRNLLIYRMLHGCPRARGF